jgi:hypothetical protein
MKAHRALTPLAVATAALLATSSIGMAQRSVPVGVQATISGAFSMETRQIDFGRVVAGVTQTLSAQSGGGNGRAGELLLSFENAGVAVVIPSEMVLTGPGGQIRATLTCARSENGQGSTSTPFSCTEGATFAPDADSRSERKVFVGGELPASETEGKAAGVYRGAVVIIATRITS